ncbi:MAG: outer membrane protein assembly factor BamD [Planctomycetaceae bacterium]
MARLLLLPALCLVLAGCQSLNLARLNPWYQTDEELASIEGVAGPLERILRVSGEGHDRQTLAPEAGREEYAAAEQLFDKGEYRAAEKEFKSLAKKYKDAPVGEDAQFMRAECQFHRKRYSWAQDSYDELMKEYPSSRHLEMVTRRQFLIAQHWLPELKNVSTSEIQQVNYDDLRSTPGPKRQGPSWTEPTRKIPLLPNFTDRTRPVFDTQGRALQALRSIWLNDPTGPLADDALMLTASYHFRKGDYEEADRVYTILREEYPKSPHLQAAFVLGSHVKLMSYQGAQYDGTTLRESAELKESIIRLFPEADRERHLEEIRKLEEAKAGHEWQMVEFYRKKGDPQAMAVYCREVLRLYPRTTYADRARQTLNELKAGHARGGDGLQWPSFNWFSSPSEPEQVIEQQTPGRAEL